MVEYKEKKLENAANWLTLIGKNRKDFDVAIGPLVLTPIWYLSKDEKEKILAGERVGYLYTDHCYFMGSGKPIPRRPYFILHITSNDYRKEIDNFVYSEEYQNWLQHYIDNYVTDVGKEYYEKYFFIKKYLEEKEKTDK